MGWLGRHWKGILAFAVSTAAFIGIAALVAWLGAPALVAMLVAGVASGALGALLGDLLGHKKPGLDVLWTALLSGAITLATLGIFKAAAPYVGPLLARIFAPAAKDAAAAGGEKLTQTVADAVEPLVHKPPVPPPAVEPPPVTPPPVEAPPGGAPPAPGPKPVSRGIVGALDGEPGLALPREANAPLDGLVHPEDASLGDGTFKETFRLKSPSGNYVMGLAKNEVYGQPFSLADQTSNLTQEIKTLEEIGNEGIPVEKVVGRGVYNGRAAYVKEAYVACTRDESFAAQGYKAMNETSLADLERIKSLVAEKHLLIDDPQFAVRPDGHVIVTDPIALHHGPTPGEDPAEYANYVQGMNDKIDEAIAFAKRAIAERR